VTPEPAALCVAVNGEYAAVGYHGDGIRLFSLDTGLFFLDWITGINTNLSKWANIHIYIYIYIYIRSSIYIYIYIYIDV